MNPKVVEKVKRFLMEIGDRQICRDNHPRPVMAGSGGIPEPCDCLSQDAREILNIDLP